jgi:GTPase SAR1 family protein
MGTLSRRIGELIEHLNDDSERPVITRRWKKPKRKRRILKSWTFQAGWEMPTQYMRNIMDDKKIFLGASDFDDYVKSEIVKRRFDAKKQTLFREITVLTNRKEWNIWSEKYFKDKLITEYNTSSGIILDEETDDFIQYYVNDNSIEIRIFGDLAFTNKTLQIVKKNFTEVGSHIEWVYSSDGRSVDVPLSIDKLPISEMYPFLKGEKLEDYYKRYLDSSSSILLLIGPPGTGKTTFIRGFLAYAESSAYVTYDSEILTKDGVFARFIESDANVMVIEDSDNFLKARTDGNNMMHRFLNVGDGLVTTKGKKMIFSTNLPSIRDIDPALVRPGRCFDILNFDLLDLADAKKLAKKVGTTLPNRENKDDSRYSVAEIYNQKIDQFEGKVVNSKFGFI